MTKKELQVEALRWARGALHDPKYLYHSGRDGASYRTDRMIRMVIKSIFSVPGSFTDPVDDRLLTEYRKYLDLNWLYFNVKTEALKTYWVSPQMLYRLHYIEDWKPKAYTDPEITALIPDHGDKSEEWFDGLVIGG